MGSNPTEGTPGRLARPGIRAAVRDADAHGGEPAEILKFVIAAKCVLKVWTRAV